MGSYYRVGVCGYRDKNDYNENCDHECSSEARSEERMRHAVVGRCLTFTIPQWWAHVKPVTPQLPLRGREVLPRILVVEIDDG